MKSREEIIQEISEKKIHLSASKMKALKTPAMFLRYFTETKTGKGMTFGSMVDTFLTVPEKDWKVKIDDNPLSDGNQTDVFKLALTEMAQKSSKEQAVNPVAWAFDQIYKRFNEATYKNILYHYDCMKEGIILVSEADFKMGKEAAEKIGSDPRIYKYLQDCERQKALKFSYRGWDFVNYMDLYKGEGDFTDLKFSSNFNPEIWDRTILQFGYDIQFGVYSIGLREIGEAQVPTGRFLVFNKNGDYFFRKMSNRYMEYCENKVDIYLNRLERYIESGAWDLSFDFAEGEKLIEKPGWMKLPEK